MLCGRRPRLNCDMQVLVRQMQQWASRLRDDLGIDAAASNEIASAIFREIKALPAEARKTVLAGEHIPFRARFEELWAFQTYMEQAPWHAGPDLVRAQVIVQIYVCFVYLGEACFKALAKATASNTVTRKCCRFLTDNPVRAFRNAISHANWQYNQDCTGLVFWARKGSDPADPLCRFEVSQHDLNFWQMLARCVAYAAFTALDNGEAPANP